MAGAWDGVPSDRVVAVVAGLDTGQVQIGSGYLVTERLVLTAGHCSVDKKTGRPSTRLWVTRRSDGSEAEAALVAAGTALDVAVLEVEDPPWEGRLASGSPRFGRVDRTHTGELRDCQAVGFPLWQFDPAEHGRNAAELHGTIRVTEDAESGLLVMRDALLSDVARGATPGGQADVSSWGGLSGALVFHQGVALGVVIEHHPRQGRSAVRIMPVQRIAAAAAGGDADAIAMASALGLSLADELPLVTPWSPSPPSRIPHRVWQVPFPVDPDFVGRDEEMAALTTALAPGTRTVVTQAISGLGGIGKTQLAAHVAHAVASRFNIIWWIAAEQRAAMEASLRALGKALRIEGDPTSRETLAELSSLEPSVNWMLIYDNVESPTSLQGMLPTRGSGVVLITTRYQDWPAWASVTGLGPINQAAAVTLLAKGMPGDGAAAKRIVEKFGRLPLALAQAAAQIRSGISLAQYEELLKSRFVDALGSQAYLPDYDRSVLDVIMLARDAAATAAAEAPRLLALLALLDPDRVEGWLIERIPEGDGLGDPLVRASALASLKRFSLATEVQGESRAYAIHRLVRDIIWRTSEDTREAIISLALRTLANAVSSLDAWTFGGDGISRILSHLRYFMGTAQRYHARETVRLLRLIASREWHGHFGEAADVWAARSAVRIVEGNPEFSENDVVGALTELHWVEQRYRHGSGKKETVAIRRALALQRKTDAQGSPAVAVLQLELASTLAGRYDWWVSFDFSDDDLAEASALTESAMSMLQDDGDRVLLASAHSLHAGIAGHLRQVDEALAEYTEAVAVAEAGARPWEGRLEAAHVLFKFGRIRDTREMLAPLLSRHDDGSDNHVFGRYQDADRFYQRCLWEQRDWREYLRYAETKHDRAARMHRKRGATRNKVEEYYSLRSVLSGYRGLEDEDGAAKIEEQLEVTVIAHIMESLARKGERAASRSPGAEEVVAILENAAVDSALPVGTDWLYELRMFDGRPDLKVRIGRAERSGRERAAERRPSKSDSSLVFYAMMREARELAALDQDAAVSVFAQGLSMIDSGAADVPRAERAKALINMAAVVGSSMLGYAQEAAVLLTEEAAHGGDRHNVDLICTLPDLLTRAARLIAKLSDDFKTARDLEFTAASLEEKVHGRIFPGVSQHLFNAAWYFYRLAGDRAGSTAAVASLEEAVEIASVCFGQDSPRWAEQAARLARTVRDANPAKAKSLLLRATQVFSDSYGPAHSSTRTCQDIVTGYT